MSLDKVSRVVIGTDGKLRPLVRALIYSALAFWLLSADEFLGPLLERWATALHATGLSPASVTYYESINLLTTLLLTWIFGLYEGRRVDDYGLPIRQAFGARLATPSCGAGRSGWPPDTTPPSITCSCLLSERGTAALSRSIIC
jgi:hypothetical protein